MERLLYAIGAIRRPHVVVAVGVFCGNTLVWNVGAAAGPGKCYDADRLIGVEINPDSAELARRNFGRLGTPNVEVLCEDGHDTLARLEPPIDLLYLDASGDARDPDPRRRWKSIYSTLLDVAYGKLAPGALVLAHDTSPAWFARDAGHYLAAVRDSAAGRRKRLYTWLALGWQAGLVLGFVHLLVDTRVPVAWWMRWFKKCGKAPEVVTIAIWLDQTVHVLCIALWVGLAR
jgi:predicted O-methyltransferase YrrM